jgi:hydroxymethylpyrimidine pyrophosphatase-like HAD family hydrolase
MIIAVDFDGTIVEHKYPKIGKEIPFAIDTLKKLQYEHYHRLILWTVRVGNELDEALEYCRARGLEFYAANANYPEEVFDDKAGSRKVKADMYIDDRNIGGLPDWGVIYQQITGTFDDQFGTKELPRKGFFNKLFG